MDGNETGIDCGGDCPNCPSNGTANPNIFGNWYKIFNITEVNNNITIRVNTNPACRTNILNQIVNSGNGVITYKTEGLLGTCAYPTSGMFSYDGNISFIHKLTPDTFIYSNNYFLKGSNPYVGEGPYIKIRFVILENECGDSSLILSDQAGGMYFSAAGQSYMEIVKQNSTNQGSFGIFLDKNATVRDSNNPVMSTGLPLSWYDSNLSNDYHITYKVQFWDKNNNLMYESLPVRKIMYGPNYLSNPFFGVSTGVQWGM